MHLVIFDPEMDMCARILLVIALVIDIGRKTEETKLSRGRHWAAMQLKQDPCQLWENL